MRLATFLSAILAAVAASAAELAAGGRVLTFGPAERGFGCRSLACGKSGFFPGNDGVPGLWRLAFRAGSGGEEKILDASSVGGGVCEKTAAGLRFAWRGVDVEEGDGALDVLCDVCWNGEEGRYEFRMDVDNRSGRYGLFSTEFPRLGKVVVKDRGSVIRPGGNWGGVRTPKPWNMKLEYPGWPAPLQMAIFENGEGESLMVAALDPDACTKLVAMNGDFDFSFIVPAENAGVPGAAGAPRYAFALYPYAGKWMKGAKLYRKWAQASAAWMKAGGNRERKDYAGRFRDAGLWMLMSPPSNSVAHVESQLDRTLELVKGRVPVSVHWYRWHRHPFDTLYPEYFPVQPGFKEAVSRLEAKGVLVTPYINGRIWDREQKDFESVKGAACRQPDGTPYKEVWNKRSFSAMCQCTAAWHDKIVDVANRLLSGCGTGGLYIDQIASMKMVVCYATDHGHPAGGGSHWVDGYRRMVMDIRKANPGKPITSENFSEPYIGVFEGFLTWSPNSDMDIPLLPAVYSGYCESFGSRTSPHYKPAAFRAVHNRNFIWGVQPGWESEWILQERYRDRFEHLVHLAEIRRGAADYFADGEFVEDVENEGETPLIDMTWERWGKPLPVKVPAMQAALWRNAAGREMLAIANHSGSVRSFRCGMLDGAVDVKPGDVRLEILPERK